jgi:hypothetical protein
VASAITALAVATGTSSAHTGAAGHAPTADTLGHSTLGERIFGTNQQRLSDPDDDANFEYLELRGGEPHAVREELARAKPGREDRRRSLIYLAQITDFQLSDEESPSRVDFLDPQFGEGGVSAAHRPQEALVPQQVEWTIRQVNEFFRSPVEQANGRFARMANAVMTGDLADNQQLNETQDVVSLLEGGTFVEGEGFVGELDPNSGSDDPDSEEDYDGLRCPSDEQGRQELAEEAPLYTGVQDYDDYPGATRSEDFYDPDEPFGEYELWPELTGLQDRAQEPFEIEGLRVPSYVAFGNHDALAQGNEDAIAAFEDIGTGCVKLFPSTAPDQPDTQDRPAPEAIRELVEELRQGLPLEDAGATLVPPDEERQYVDSIQFKELHDTGEQADEHGFAFIDQDELDASNGAASYYSFVPDSRNRAVRYIVLDTVSEGGVTPESSNGNIDEPQWRWLTDELERAQRRNELIVVFGHHATGSLTANVADELIPSPPGPLPGAPPCSDPPGDDEHGHNVNPGCDMDPRNSQPLHFGEDLARLFKRTPNVVAYVAGHSHENLVTPFEGRDGGDFWEIKTPAIVDWPPQHRLIEVMNNRDGTLSIFGTVLDHGAPVNATESADTADASLFDSAALASIGRTIAFNDPQVGPGGPEGEPDDRNVELLLRDPRTADDDDRPPQEPPDDPPPPTNGGPDGPGGDGPGGDGPGGDGPGGDSTGQPGGSPAEDAADDQARTSLGAAAGAGSGGGDLPFTGLALALLALLGVALASAGAVFRRRASG